ncbi:MAG: glucosamine-6-phosphate deaminase, partial [Bacteroidales bacterium]|nr:glucosamine-6-phosphate deaminase [Bacteroidales bacterium]
MRLIIQKSYADMSKWAASLILKRITDFDPSPDRPFVLGLPTGSTPIGTYKELVHYYRCNSCPERRYSDKSHYYSRPADYRRRASCYIR